MDQDDAVYAGIEDTSGVLVAQRAANIEKLHKVRTLPDGALPELVDLHLYVAAHRPARSYQGLIVRDQVRQAGLTHTCGKKILSFFLPKIL